MIQPMANIAATVENRLAHLPAQHRAAFAGHRNITLSAYGASQFLLHPTYTVFLHAKSHLVFFIYALPRLFHAICLFSKMLYGI